jgi:hypothetical protein
MMFLVQIHPRHGKNENVKEAKNENEENVKNKE